MDPTGRGSGREAIAGVWVGWEDGGCAGDWARRRGNGVGKDMLTELVWGLLGWDSVGFRMGGRCEYGCDAEGGGMEGRWGVA